MIVGTYGADKFAVTSGGSCTTNGACFQSRNYPNDYGVNDKCSITVQNVLAGETLSSVAFNTESNNYDKLLVAGTYYSGTSGPFNVTVSVNDEFTWESDYGAEKSGFQVCLVGACLETDGSQANADACRCGTVACSSSSGLFCTSSINTCHPLSQLPVYNGRTSGNCGDMDGQIDGQITSQAACEAGAAAQPLSDTTAYPVSRSDYPPGCYYTGYLYFNTDNSNYACSPTKKCLCTLTCQPGTYQDQLGQSTCKSCLPGTYQDQLGQNECKSCGAGSFTNTGSNPGATTCSTCTTIANAAVQCTSDSDQTILTCDAGYYRSPGDASCSTCATIANAATVQCTSGSDQTILTCDVGYYYGSAGSCWTCTTIANAATVQCTSGSDQTILTCDVGYYGSSGDASCKSCQGDYSLGGSKCVTKEKFKAAYSTQSAQC